MNARGETLPDRDGAEQFLLSCGAAELPHPGGTLYEHLRRVAALLAGWGASPDLVAAGLCHATYGTDGYSRPLLPIDDRARLAALIGPRAESLVYLYASCDRAVVYPRLPTTGPVPFRDRFTGRTHTPPEPDVRAFVELTAANELDIVAHNTATATEYGASLLRLLSGARARLSAAAWQSCTRVLGPDQGHPVPPVSITGLDHLVLTVASPERTTAFYQRVLGMQPVTFGNGRQALRFGPSKINLHQAGREITPHATHPVPGSADLCLLTTTPPEQILDHLAQLGISAEDGPVPRTGARGAITSIYIRDPDGNLIEIASYTTPPGETGTEC